MSIISRSTNIDSPLRNFASGETVTIEFSNISSLKHHYDAYRKSETFPCANYEWQLRICRRGELLSVYLYSKTGIEVMVKFEVAVLKSTGAECMNQSKDNTFNSMGTKDDKCGWQYFASMKEIFDKRKNHLNMGTLTLVLSIWPGKEYQHKRRCAIPLRNIFNEGNADVAFQVQDRVIFGHKTLFESQEPELFKLVEQFEKDKPMQINDVEPEIFDMMLKYVYGEEIYPANWRDHLKAILGASSKYGFSKLRDEAETKYMKSVKLTAANAMDELLDADAFSARNIKESIFDFIVQNVEEVESDPSWKKLDDSPKLLKELFSKSCKKRKCDEVST